MDVAEYLSRIGYHGPLLPDTETLHRIHLQHLLTVPFENLDIGLHRPIVLREDLLLDKIVHWKRGGFCYELNGAFAWLLRQLGYDVTYLSARVPRADGSRSPEFDHMTLKVQVPGTQQELLADVGFGDCFREPLLLKRDVESPQGRWRYTLVNEHEQWSLQRRESYGEWRQQYEFTLVPRCMEEYAPMCEYHQTSPASWFTQRRICSRATEHGRVTISDEKLIVSEGDQVEETLLTPEQWRPTLHERFGIVLD